jgi:hypothetical protein
MRRHVYLIADRVALDVVETAAILALIAAAFVAGLLLA